MQNDRIHVFRVALVNLDISMSTSGRFYTNFLIVSMIMVSLSLPIIQVQVFLKLFSIGHTFTTSTSPEIGLVCMISISNPPWSFWSGK